MKKPPRRESENQPLRVALHPEPSTRAERTGLIGLLLRIARRQKRAREVNDNGRSGSSAA